MNPVQYSWSTFSYRSNPY